MDRKRKRNERKLGLLGLENIDYQYDNTNNKLMIKKTKMDNNHENNGTSNHSLKEDANPTKRRKLNPTDSEVAKTQNETETDTVSISNESEVNAKKMDNLKGDIDLSNIKDVNELKKLGMDTLKKEFKFMG